MSKKPNLAAVLSDAGGGTRRKPEPEPIIRSKESPQYRQPGRDETAPITVHFPAHVREQLKILAAEQRRTLQDMMAESLNYLFAKYGKPEIAPRSSQP